MIKKKTNFTDIAGDILMRIDFLRYREDCAENSHELRDRIEKKIRRHFSRFDDMYHEIEREHAALLFDIENFVVEDESDAKKLDKLRDAAKRKYQILTKVRGE